MTISRDDWRAFVRRLSAVNAAAAAAMEAWMTENPAAETAAVIRAAYAIGTQYGEASAALACLLYDAIGAAEGLALPAAAPAATVTYDEAAKAVLGTLKNLQSTVPATVGRLTKQAGQDTLLHNALRDGAEFAWIVSGDTCPFCLMLASNGWQRMSRKALRGGHAEHIHPNCDCSYAIRHNDRTRVAGYDPKAYYDRLRDADPSGTWGDRINALRRQQYQADKDEINARKRIAYRAAKDRESDETEGG